MNQVTIKQLQTELIDTEAEIEKLDKKVDMMSAKLDEARSARAQANGNRTALRRLLKQNDALPEGTK
jgi:peptidoglycan hydrolase CwlO-like protein